MHLLTIGLENNAGGCMAALRHEKVVGQPIEMADTPWEAISQLLTKHGPSIMDSETLERQLSVNRDTLTIEIVPF